MSVSAFTYSMLRPVSGAVLRRRRRRRRRRRLACGLALTLLLSACSREEEMLPGSVSGYNHMQPGIGWSVGGFSVDGASGPNVQPESGGGKFSCCASYPQQWHPGMKVKVRWFYNHKASNPDAEPPPRQEAIVEVPEYTPESAGTVNVHFYPEHRVKVVISRYDIEHPRYPMSDQDKLPWVTRQDLIGK